MKRFWIFITTFSLVEWIGRHPATAGFLMLLGVGGGVGGIAALTPPTITPVPAAYFNQNQAFGETNNGLQLNGGSTGPMSFPSSDVTGSMAAYFEAGVDSNLSYNQTNQYLVGGLVLYSNTIPGLPVFVTGRALGGQSAAQWWQAASAINNSGQGATAGSSYNAGFYPFTATGGPCVVEPSGVWLGGSASVQVTNPGFECQGETLPAVNIAALPGAGARQATGTAAGPVQTATSCAVVNGEAVVTAHLAVAHGLVPGLTYALSSFTPGGYNGTYTALQGTTGSTLVGNISGTSSCPAAVSVEGTALSGTGAAIIFPSLSSGSPYSPGGTGITTKSGQHICGMIGENGDDSAFPGSAFISMVDDKGNALPGSPALVTSSLNLGTANFTGYVLASAQSPSTPALVVTAMNPYTITNAVFGSGANPNGTVTFTTSTNPGFVPGSEFTVSGLSPSGFNHTYVAIAGTSGTTIVGNPLSGVGGGLSPITSPGAFVSGGQMVSVIMPGMRVLGSSPGASSAIVPYGMFGGTGLGGVGTYGLTSNQSTFTFTASIAATTGVMTVTGAPSGFFQQLAVGEAFSGTGTGSLIITGYISGSGSTGTYNTNYTTATAIGSETMTAAGTIGSSGAPVTLFASPAFYYQTAGSSTPAGGTVSNNSLSVFGGDFLGPVWGANGTGAAPSKSGWGGSIANVAMLYGPQPLQSGGVLSTTALASLCKKTTTVPAFAAANSLTVNSFYPLSDIGVYGDASVAQLSGYITATSGATTGVLNLSEPPITGALTGSGTPTLSGPGIPGCPSGCPTVTRGAGPTYAVTWASGIGANVGSSGSPVEMAAGAYKPATPLASSNLEGYIDTAGGGGTLPTLHITAFPTNGSAFFTGQLSSSMTGTISGSVLTVTAIPSGALSVIGVGTIINSAPGAATSFGPLTVTSLGTGIGGTGTYNLSGSTTVSTAESILGTGVLPSGPTTLSVSGVTSVIAPGMYVTDLGVNLTAQPLLITGGSGTTWTVAGNYYGPIAAESMTASLGSIVPGAYIQNAGITTPVKVLAYQGPCPTPVPGAFNGGLGCYTLSTGANGTVASSGSPATFAINSITDGGAIAPGPALTIRNQGPGVTFPVDTSTISCTGFGSCTGSGTLHLSGTYDTPTLGGTPSGIQVLVSQSAGGAALAGCTPCNWGTLTATISGGAWSGTISGIPPGGPYSVSVRATNGQNYATLPEGIRIGQVFDLYGQGQMGAFLSTQSGTNLSFFEGFWGAAGAHSPFANNEQYLAGPPVTANFVPAQALATAGDRFGINGAGIPLSEAGVVFEQLMNNAFGWPQSLLNITHDGIGNLLMSLGNAAQTQTVGVGDGSTTQWCSASIQCSNVSISGPLYFNAASLTGASLAGATINNGSGAAGNTLSVPATTGLTLGALAPGMVLTDTTGHITGTPTLVNCASGCTIGTYTPGNPAAQTWTISGSAQLVAAEAMRADPTPGPTPFPNFNYQVAGLPFGFAGYGAEAIQAGTFKITNTTTGTVLCQDSQTFAYNASGGNCTGAGIASSFVNYQTGDYQITFSSAPASGNVLTASWTNIITPETPSTSAFTHPQNLDYFGNGADQSGLVSSVFNKTPGGVSGHINNGCSTDEGYIEQSNAHANSGYQFGAPGYSEMDSWLYGTKFSNLLSGMSAATPQITAGQFRGEGGQFPVNSDNAGKLNICDQLFQDMATKSTFSGTISGGTLTLSAAAVGPMWEGEVIGGGGMTSPTGVFITSLASGAWGASGSTYNVSNALGLSASGAMFNDVYYKGSGPAIYGGTFYDTTVQNQGLNGTVAYNPHLWLGQAGGRRVAARLAATIWGALTSTPVAGTPPANASPPSVDRVKADTSGCDSSAIGSPCFDIGNTFATVATPTAVTSNKLTFNGLAAHARPIVVGQAVSCSGCATGLVVTAVDHPPTQDTRAGQGQIGSLNNGFVVTLNAAPGASGVAFIFGCSGTAGTGSNCIDIAISVNTTAGSFGTTAALATCGANNLNGNAENYQPPGGPCHDSGVGEIVRAFRVGTSQFMYGTGTTYPTGSVFDDGMDFFGGAFNQSAAFTCNIVAAKVAQCVKGPQLSSGVFSSIGQWASGSTFINYGDMSEVTGRAGAVIGYPGGQSFPFTSGSGYTPTSGSATYTSNAASCPTVASGAALPKFDITVTNGSISNVYPSNVSPAMGYGIGAACTVPLPSAMTSGGGSGGAISIPIAPSEGLGGVATVSSDSNMMGLFLYDNTGFVGNPLNAFFTNGQGGYFEPGLPVRPFGQFQGLAVSG
jgi:hypothetical protein